MKSRQSFGVGCQSSGVSESNSAPRSRTPTKPLWYVLEFMRRLRIRAAGMFIFIIFVIDSTCYHRSEWSEDSPVVINDLRGNPVYTQEHDNIGDAISWIWRELLLPELANGKPVRKMLAEISKVDHLVGVIEILPSDKPGMFSQLLLHSRC